MKINRKEAENSKELKLWAHPKTHAKVLEIFAGFKQKGRVLDMAAGEGSLSLNLQGFGFDVSACDIDPENFKVDRVECTKCNLDEKLPFEDKLFDYLVCIEGIEHLENQFSFIRECHRILKKGGRLVITTPNILGLASRLKYLFTGFFPLVQRPINEFIRCRLHDHINPITYYQLRYILHTNGFEIEEVTTDRHRTSSSLLVWLYPFLRISTRSTMKKEADPKQREANKVIRRHINSKALLLGRTLIVTARSL